MADTRPIELAAFSLVTNRSITLLEKACECLPALPGAAVEYLARARGVMEAAAILPTCMEMPAMAWKAAEQSEKLADVVEDEERARNIINRMLTLADCLRDYAYATQAAQVAAGNALCGDIAALSDVIFHKPSKADAGTTD